MGKKLKDWKTHHQIIFALIIGFAVISFWRGLWGLMDLHVFPENAILSYLISIVIGIVILASTHYATKELM